MENILIFIGARGGSKGVPGKNVKPILGKPLIRYTIDQAKKWGKAKRIIVSTDSKDIKKIAEEAGLEVPFMRPAELATDTAAKGKAIKHALLECEKTYGETYDIVMDLDVTAPIRKLSDLDRGLELFLKHRPKTLYSVVESHKNPYFNIIEVKEDGRAHMSKQPAVPIRRRQDAPKTYSCNAAIYFYRRDYLLSQDDPHAMTDDTRVYEMDDISGIDIDREIDFKYVEFLMKEGMVKL